MSLYTKIIDRQKLKAAWEHVKANSPAAGADGVTWQRFDEAQKENLVALSSELTQHTYHPGPMKTVTLRRGEKEREVSLFCMRDKVVQQSIAQELGRLYDSRFSPSVYAYRPGRSALEAVDRIAKELRSPDNAWILKTDIKSFFDSIVLQRLYDILAQSITDQDALQLIRICCETREFRKDGAAQPRTVGVSQGSGFAPILSNIYLMEFDRAMDAKDIVYVRYSDDMILLGRSREQMETLRDFIQEQLTPLGLHLNAGKTTILPAGDGVDFLGYRLSSSGKAIPAKAEDTLQQRLEKLWLGEGTTNEKLRKGAEILNGWEQYYRGDRRIGSIEEYAVVVYMVRGKDREVLDAMKAQRGGLDNTYREICRYLAEVWADDWSLVLFEYEQFFHLQGLDAPIKEGAQQAFCDCYRELLIQETQEQWIELMQRYADAESYNTASKIQEQILRMDQSTNPQGIFPSAEALTAREQGGSEEKGSALPTDSAFLQAFLQNFAGREDTYGVDEVRPDRKRCVVQKAEPLTEDVLRAHMAGNCTVSTYVQRANGTVHYLVIDMDISKRFLIEEGSETAIRNHLPAAAGAAAQMLRLLERLGLKGYPEYSGYRGFHIWVFFSEWIPTRYVNMLTDVIEEQWKAVSTASAGKQGAVPACAGSGDRSAAAPGSELTIEFFPNKGRLRNGSPGQCIKLPYGLHTRSGVRSVLLDAQFQEISPSRELLTGMAQSSRQEVKRIIGTHAEACDLRDTREVDRDLQAFGPLPDNVKAVLEHCNLMRYLCQRARTTGYLSHFERLSVLYVFGHLGDEGKQFVHTVMEFTLNYKFHVTDRFISRLPAKPVSCMKLQDQYQQITAEFGCSCNFRRTKNCYPSPVLHAIRMSGDQAGEVTVPTSKGSSKEKQQKVIEEININKKVEELAAKIVEMKKQRRGVDRNIQKAQKELERLFDQAGIDALEVSMGVMVRRKTQDGYEWLIEI